MCLLSVFASSSGHSVGGQAGSKMCSGSKMLSKQDVFTKQGVFFKQDVFVKARCVLEARFVANLPSPFVFTTRSL